jgi:hypothetical protein
MAFAGAQVFYIDPGLVASSTTVNIDRIDLFFKSKPQATNNKSGINNPGVQVFLTSVANNIPSLPLNISTMRWSRVEYNNINISTDATIATTFRFDPPVPFPADSKASFVMQFDGSEDFVPWADTTGDYLVGTTTPSNGPSGSSIGGFFSFISAVPSIAGNNTSNSTMVTSGTTSNTGGLANATYAASAWTAKLGTVLKFKVYIARYSVNGNQSLSNFTNNSSPSAAQIQITTATTTTSNGEVKFILPQDRYEYLAYDRINSAILNVSPGERVFPVLPFYPPGQANLVTLNCVANSNTITATGNINWNSLLSISASQPENLVITSRNHLGANADVVNVVMVTNIISNTQIQVDMPLSFTNAVANFYRAPIATIDQFKRARFFGNDQDVVICKHSTANAALRFSGHSVNSISIANGGTGYSNTDWVNITGHTQLAGKVLAPHNANANILTNANGTLTALYLANVGSGFSNIANVSYTIANTGGANSVGTGANLTISIGTNLKSEYLGFNGKGGNFANSRPINIEIGETMPGILVSNPSGTFYTATIRFPYYSLDDATVPSGRQTYCDADGNWDILNIETFTIHEPFEFAKRRVLPSWSNELYIPYANGASSQGFGGTSNTPQQALSSNASVITITTVSNNDFVAVTAIPSGSKITYSRYIINNDYTNENTNYGNAWARGIETQFNLANNALAEDLLVYATVYKPANTDVLCFARIYNTHDNDAFDSKEWTMMQLRSGNNIVSSPTNLQDTYELTWGFQQYPNVAFQCAGTVTTANNSKIITGSNTTFSSNLVSGDLLLIQNGLFPNLYMVAVANVITNATSMTINKPIANLNLVGSGFIVSKLAYKFQAFNNSLNDNLVRYYSSTLTENDGFNTCAIKLVMLSANGLIVPLIADLRATAVSA